jgi:hypothetical protein
MRVALAALGAALFHGLASAQCTQVVPGQYLGTPWAHTLPRGHATLSNITFFKIKDPSGEHVCTSDPASDLSFLTYLSLNSTGGRLANNAIRRVVIVIAGAGADAGAYHQHVLDSLLAMRDSTINPNSVAVVAPYFPNDNHATRGFPYNPNGATPDERYPSPALVWYGSDWGGGANNQYPPRLRSVSSFDAIDQIIQYYGNLSLFPNLKHIVVAGHSMGAQMLSRYAAVGKTRAQLGSQVPISHYVANPSSHTWFTTDRPLSTGKCPNTFNNWREGLGNYSAYGTPRSTSMVYNSALLAQGSAAVLANYRGKTVAHGRGTNDKGDYSEGNCAPYTGGRDRHERFFKFAERFPPACPNPRADGCHTVDFVASSHSDTTMFSSVSGQARLFRDNFNGDGARAYDFGYPRHASYDNPYPDPAQAGRPLIYTDTTTYAGGKTHRGCFTDIDKAQSAATLPVLAYTGDSNSRTYCANLCTQQGYTIAGLRATSCYCGNALHAQATDVVVSNCITVCPADSSFCGGTERLTILSSVDV